MKRNNKKKSKSQVKRKKTKSKGGTITGSLRKKYEAKVRELKKKSRRLKREKQEHKKQELQRNTSADRAKIPNFEERIRNLTLKAPVRPIKISRRSSKKKTKPTKKSGEDLEFKKEPVQKIKKQPSALSRSLQ